MEKPLNTKSADYNTLKQQVEALKKQVSGLQRMEKKNYQQLRKFQVLYDLAIAITSEGNLKTNLQVVVDKSRQLLGTDTAYIALRDEERREVFIYCVSGIRTETFRKIRLPFGEGLGGSVAKTGRGYIIDNYFTSKTLSHKAADAVAQEGLTSGMAVPMQVGQKNLGVLYAFDRAKRHFSQSDLDTLFLIGNLAAVEVSRQQTHEGLKKAHGELEQRVQERTAALAKSNELLKQEIAERKRAVEKMRQSEKRLSEILDGTSIPTFVIDQGHVVTHCNKAFENLTGIAAEEIIGTQKQWMSFYPQKRPVMADFIIDQVPGTEIANHYAHGYQASQVIEGAYEAEGFFPSLGNEGKWLFFTAAPLKDREGNVTGAIETLQDITKRKQAEAALRESESRYRKALEFAPYPLVVFTLDGRVSYLNPAFTQVFGWSLAELEGKKIPYVPPGLEQETSESIRQLFEDKVLMRHETRRVTKDGLILDVILRAAVISDDQGRSGELVILRDVTQEKRITRNNQALLRISMALPEYPDLEDLLNYVSKEIKDLLEAEGGAVILLDEEKQEIFFPGVAYDDTSTQQRMKGSRIPAAHADEVVVSKVMKTGEPVIVNDTAEVGKSYPLRDRMLGYSPRNFVQVAAKSSERIIGVLCAINKKEGRFDQTDVDLLTMIAGTVALSIENARFSNDLKKAYTEVSSMNRAKDKVFHHLSHELKTPVSVLMGSLDILEKVLAASPREWWAPTMERARRGLQRIMEIQYQVEDIIQDRSQKTHDLLTHLLDECSDELQTLVAAHTGEGPVVERVRSSIEALFGPKALAPEELRLDEFVHENLDRLRPAFSHREVEIFTRCEPAAPIFIPKDVLQKVMDGLIKNAVENTPDEGKIVLTVQKRGPDVEFQVQDFGVGITGEAQRRIFEGFFTTQETLSYSTKKPFDFNAGGKGADLLRMKVFSERHHFKIHMTSSRCRYISEGTDICPGRISLCRFCRRKEDCYDSGGTTFSLVFPRASGPGLPAPA